MSERQTVRQDIEIARVDEGSITLPLTAMIEQLSVALETIPPEHRDTAQCCIWGGGDCSLYVEVFYDRPETDAEISFRKSRDAYVVLGGPPGMTFAGRHYRSDF
jgi:hypothetical protein